MVPRAAGRRIYAAQQLFSPLNYLADAFTTADVTNG